ncbi:MAG: hypothetical protein J6386_14395 [Candidatus Synoicihabitans palmerolidicus]|nr:hypothetical protein [Candidatus Synoicihabitans palmerolidicus]
MQSKGETETEATHENPEQKRWDRNLEVRMATAAEQEWFDAQLHERHYLERVPFTLIFGRGGRKADF